VRRNLEVEFISAEETMDLRMRVLRPSQARERCLYAEDSVATTFHLGIRIGEALVCVGTLIEQDQPLIISEIGLSYRLRGMATDPQFQRLGLGSLVVRKAEEELVRRQIRLLWFNARVSAEAFYGKLGYQSQDRIFAFEDIGPHKVMYKLF
jgi:GNAT superfamily N-acetyltransferase